MPGSALLDDDCTRILDGQHLVRVAFRDGESLYLIPLGYVWFRSALYGVAERGRKTVLAERNALVAFQVDTSMQTGLWEWESVTGEGRFALVEAAERQEALSALQPVIAAAPEWWRREEGPSLAAGALVVWRLSVTHVAGSRYAPGRGEGT
jgi:nitroimidazol reductase NimA-like FMN-containing flavoprotein (pyridoxamine 5'-phosphate oxidase superfamily)